MIRKNKGFRNNRFKSLIAIMAFLFMIIISRLIYLQVFRHEDFKEKADTRSMRFMAEKAPRGKIYDSKGNVLATNKQTYIATFTETESSKEAFYRTMNLFFKVMKENNEQINDNLDLIINENGKIVFDFGFENEDNIRAAELRFKKDRGLEDEIKKELYPKQSEDLTDEQIETIEKKLLEITPEQVFYYLVKKYDMAELLSEYKDRDKNMTSKEDANYRKAIKNRYNQKELSDYENGKKLLDDLLKENSLEEIRNYMVIKDAIKMQSFSGFRPVVIAPTMSKDTAFILSQKLNDLNGIDIALEPVRYYPYGQLGAHFLGYVGAIPSSSKDKYEQRGYDISTDLIGMAGIESSFESILKGTKGGDMVKVNAEGRRRESLYSMQTTPGKNVHLTIDKDLQYSAEKMLEYQLKYLQTQGNNATRGAAVAINVKTGEVLAMASYPSYDPNMFATGKVDNDKAKDLISPDLESFGKEFISRRGLKKTLDEVFPKDSNGARQDPNDLYPKAMFNYATMGLIPPGSVFKPITAIAALEEGVMGAYETINDGSVLGSGYQFIKYPNLIKTPKDNGFHGVVDVRGAIQKSCNSYFYETAVRLYRKYENSVEALNSIAKYAWQFGIGNDPNKEDSISGTGIEIAERASDVYNVESSKEKFQTFSMWEMVDGMKNGQMRGSGNTFVSVDIEKKTDDSKDLKEAKENLKTLVKEQIGKFATDEYDGSEVQFKKEAEKRLKDIYDTSDIYKDNIKKKNADAKKQYKIVAEELWNWLHFTVRKEVTSAGNLANAAIGQGDTNVTPLQMASAIATLANGGTRYKVSIVDKITTADGELVEDFKPEVIGKVDVSKSTLDIVKEGMYRVNHVAGGTAIGTFANFPIKTAGKTGTATFKADQEEYGRKAFGVYVSYAPIEDPEIAVCVVGYDSDGGSKVAIVARAIYETYWRDEIKSKYPGYTPRTANGEEYTYTLNPESMNYQDTGIFYETEIDKVIKHDSNDNKENTDNKEKKEN